MTADEFFATVVLPWLQREEGDAFVVDPVPTRCGITQGAWDAWAGRPPEAPASVADLTWTQAWVATFYQERYWIAAECDKITTVTSVLALAVALVTMDTAVNSGVHVADVLLQGAVAVTPDGDVGPLTLAAIGRATERDLEDILWLRLDYDRAAVRHKPGLLQYLPTWCGRLSRLRTLALIQVHG